VVWGLKHAGILTVLVWILIAIPVRADGDSHDSSSSDDPLSETAGDAVDVRQAVPGKLIADRIEYAPDGIIIAQGNVTFESPNLLPDGAIKLTTDELVFSNRTGDLCCTGRVNVELVGNGTVISGQDLVFNTKTNKGKMNDIRGSMPVEFAPDLDMPPSYVFILGGDLDIEVKDNATHLRLYQARLSTYPFDDTDMWFQMKEIELMTGDYIEMKKSSAYLSGFRVMYWPKYHYSFEKHPGIFKSNLPIIGYNSDDGLRISYSPTVFLGPLTTQINFDYWTKRGLLTEYDHFFEFEDFKLGCQHGEVWAQDIDNETAIYKKRYNAYISGEHTFKKGFIRELEGRIEYGRLKQELPDLTGERLAARFDVNFKRKPLGDGMYFAVGIGARHFRYFDMDLAENDFTVFTSRAAFGRMRIDGTDKVEVRFNPKSGTPAFRFDDTLNELELVGTKHVKLNDDWMAVGYVLYDVDHGEFDNLSLEFRKLNKAYTMGLSWDFSSNSAQLTLGVRFW